MASVKGGDKLVAYLDKVGQQSKRASHVRVGFLGNEEYPDGTPVSYIAAIQEFGATINVAEHEATIYKQVNAKGTAFTKNGKFVKKAQSNFAQTVTVPAHQIVIPSRPYFRSMISNCSPEWGKQMSKVMKANGYDAEITLKAMGDLIAGQLRDSILKFTTPANAKSTIAKKGFDKPLIHTKRMLGAVNSEVVQGVSLIQDVVKSVKNFFTGK